MNPVRLLPRGLRLASWDLNRDRLSPWVGELVGKQGLEASARETSERTESIDGISLMVVTDEIRECASDLDVARDARLLWLSEYLCLLYSDALKESAGEGL
jgi:hypothetical protein